jgi:hypothetical protein
VKISKELMGQIEEACKKLDMSKSKITRRGILEFIYLYCPEVLDEDVSVIEPHEV